MLCAGLLLNQVKVSIIIKSCKKILGTWLINYTQKEWKVFKEIPEFLILVTPLLGLKGNLEMTLSSRLGLILFILIYCKVSSSKYLIKNELGTHANLGHMDLNHTKYHIAFGNLALTQVQVLKILA